MNSKNIGIEETDKNKGINKTPIDINAGNKKKWIIPFVIIILVIIIAFILIFYYVNKTISGKIIYEDDGIIDLENHPIYSKYEFSQEKNIINLGVQPLWIPTSSISEIMQRDSILIEELKKLGYEIRFYPFLKGNDINYFLLKGDLDAGIVGNMPSIRAGVTGNVTIISLIQQGPVSIISKDILKIEDLKGKKIAYALGSNAHFYLIDTLQKNDISEQDVTLVEMDIIFMPNALEEGIVDAFAAWEPTPAIALKQNPEFITTHQGTSYGFLYIDKNLINENRDVARQLIASEIRALEFIRHSEKNIDLTSAFVKSSGSQLSNATIPLSIEEISTLAKKDLPGILTKEYPRINKESIKDGGMINQEFELLKNINLIDKNSKWDILKNSFDLEIIEEVISNPEKYHIFKKIELGDKNEY